MVEQRSPKPRAQGSSPCAPAIYGSVVQLVRTLACHARGRGFEPHPNRHYASVAQLVEQGTENPRVVGSIPTGGTTFCADAYDLMSRRQDDRTTNIYADLAHLVERDLAKVEVAGSSPVIRSIWEFSSAGRASALQAECQRFDPVNSHHKRIRFGSSVG